VYSRLIPFALAFVAIVFASNSIDYWTVMRFFGSRGLGAAPDAWKDQVFFARPAVLPFRSAFLFATSRIRVRAGDSLRAGLLGHSSWMAVGRTFPIRKAQERAGQHDYSGTEHAAAAGRNARWVREDHRCNFVAGIRGLDFLGNYELLLNSHAFMTGADYVDEKVTLPPALAPDCCHISGAAAGLDAEV